MHFSKEERYAISKSNKKERSSRKRDWKEVIRYCEICFYKLEDNISGSNHPPGGCREAQLSKKPLNPQMFQILKDRKNGKVKS